MAIALPTLEYLALLSDDTGVIQHAVESIPNRSTGYCTDDIARAFMVALAYQRVIPQDALAQRLASTYLSFLQNAQLEDGRFHNFMDYDRTWLDDVGTHDSCGRAMWSLGYGMRYAGDEAWQRVCARLLERAVACVEWLEHPRAEAYAMIGLAHACAVHAEPRARAALRALGQASVARYERERADDWEWFEPVMTYDNARLPEALLRAGKVLGEQRFIDVGLRTLAFYESVTIEDGIYVPIGNDGWYQRGGERSRYAQQPLEAVGLVDAELAAFAALPDAGRLARAELGLAWYHGKNSRGAVMAANGGCFDGLSEDGVNHNMGAESSLSYLSASYALAAQRGTSLRIATR